MTDYKQQVATGDSLSLLLIKLNITLFAAGPKKKDRKLAGGKRLSLPVTREEAEAQIIP